MSFLRLLNTYVPPSVEDTLHVVAVISNPCLYRRRYELARGFFQRMNRTPHVVLYVVELVYGDQPYAVTDAKNPRHLQLRADSPIWHKENMINLGVRRLLPSNWKAFAWIDADIEFTNPNWARDTLRALSEYAVVQPFAKSVHLDSLNRPTSVEYPSVGYVVQHKNLISYGNCGYAWAMTRTAYERVGGLYEHSIMGGGDAIMSMAFTRQGSISKLHVLSKGFQTSIKKYCERGFCSVGYVEGEVHHYFHGSLKNRKYVERWETLVRHQYDPYVHLSKDVHGVLIPSPECPPELLEDILTYFAERNEDESIDDHRAQAPL